MSLIPYTVAKAANVLDLSPSGVKGMIGKRLEQFPVHGNAILITGESVKRVAESGCTDARKVRQPESDWEPVCDE